MKTGSLRCGVIGVGGMGAAHAAFVAQIPETELCGVTDIDAGAAERVAVEWGAKAYDSCRALLDAGPEAVIIATPHPLHAAMVKDAARRGIHVLCEKPIAISVAEADAMIETCRANGVLLGVVFQQRTDPSRRALKQLLDENILGPLHRVSMTVPYYRPQAYYDSAAWRGTWRGEGGGIMMQAAHALDQIAWLAGLPRSVQSLTLTRLHDIEVENTAVALLDWGEGKAGWFYTSTAETLGGERLEIAGDRGALVWEDGRLRRLTVPSPMSQHARSAGHMFEDIGGQWDDVPIEAAPRKRNDEYRAIIAAFARAVREDDASLMFATGEDGLASLELANAILLAGHCHQPVELPLDRVRYQNFLESLQA